MSEPTPAPCAVHPASYHARPQVLPQGSKRVFRFESVVGLPRRCARLEEELMESDREVELMGRLWILERRRAGHFVAIAIASASVGALVGLAVGANTLTPTAAGPVAVAMVIAVSLAVVVDRVVDRVFAVRLDRVRDWRKRLGY